MTTANQRAVDVANRVVHGSNASDFRLQSLNGDRLLLIGGFDLAYYHQIELLFEDVQHISLPVYGLNWPRLAIVNARSNRHYKHLELDDGDTLFELTSDPDFENVTYYVVGAKLTATEGTVYHYRRDGLKPGERIAPWVDS